MNTEPSQPEIPSPTLSRYPMRAIAFILDSILGTVLAIAIIMMVIYPIAVPDYQERMQEIQKLVTQFSPDEQENEAFKERLVELIGPLGTTGPLSYLVLMTLFYTLVEVTTKGSSPGKLLFRYRVYSIQDRQPVKPVMSLLRAFIKTFTLVINLPGFLGTLFFVGIVLLPLFSRRRQALHDMLSKTLLVDEKPMWVRLDQQPSANSGTIDI